MILTPRCGHNEALASGLRCSLWGCTASVNGDMPFCVWLTRSYDIYVCWNHSNTCAWITRLCDIHVCHSVHGSPGHMIYRSVGIIPTPVQSLPGYVIYMSVMPFCAWLTRSCDIDV